MKYCFVITLLLFVSACSSSEMRYKDATEFSLNAFPKEIILHGEEVMFDDAPLKPIELTIIDSVLLVQEMRSDTLYSAYNIHTLKKAGKFISFGGGPEEMLNGHLMQSNDSAFWILDRQKQKIYSYNVASLGMKDLNSTGQVLYPDPFGDAVVLKDGTVAALAHNPDYKRIALYDSSGCFKESKCTFPDTGQELSFVEKIEGYSSNMIINSQKDRILLCYKLTDLVEVYDMNLTLLARYHGPDHFFPAVKVIYEKEQSRALSIKGQVRDGYFSPVAVGDEFFILYSGKYFTGEPNYLMNQLFVFDCNGKPRKRFKLDIPVFCITVDAKQKKIYGITDYPEYRIIQFEL